MLVTQINEQKIKEIVVSNDKLEITTVEGKNEKALKEKYGLYGSQGKTKKRQSLMELVRGDKKSGLSQEQVKRNLELNKRKDEPGLNKLARKITFAGKVAGPAARTKGAMSDIGVKTNVIGFAQNSNKKPPVDPSPKVPSGGVRPIGL